MKKNSSERNDEGESHFNINRNTVREEFKIQESNIKRTLT